MPCTSTGVSDRLVGLSPQQSMWPLDKRAQVGSPSAVIWVAVLMPCTSTGVSVLLVVPFPSSPLWLSPQQSMWPLASSAHVCTPPELTWVAVVMLSTSTGVSDELPVVPSPSWPLLFSPQQSMWPLESSAQVSAHRALTWVRW